MKPEIVDALQAHPWQGNVRELEHVMQRAVIACQGPLIELDDLGLTAQGTLTKGDSQHSRGGRPVSPVREIVPLDELERRHILAVLEATNWKIKGDEGAASLLGLPSSTLNSRMKKLGIKRARRSAG